MKRKILFSDFDGTLYVNACVSEEDREALRRWRSAGNLFAMASGRQVSALRDHLASEGVEWDFLLCLNGAEAYDQDENLLFETPIDISILPDLYHIIVQDDGWANVCYGSRADRVRTESCSDYNADHAHYPESHLETFSRFTQICTAKQTDEEAPAVKARVLEQFGEYVCAELNGRCIDVNARGVSKASGIAKLIEALGIDAEDVVTVGDNFNDLCMLTAYNGYAVAHAPEAVRCQAKRTVKNIAEMVNQLMSEETTGCDYGKLVRDNIPEIIRDAGGIPQYRTLDHNEYVAQLHQKLIEEANEYISDETPEEIADILEVIDAICAAKNYDMDEILRIKAEKRSVRGSFDERIYLIRTD